MQSHIQCEGKRVPHIPCRPNYIYRRSPYHNTHETSQINQQCLLLLFLFYPRPIHLIRLWRRCGHRGEIRQRGGLLSLWRGRGIPRLRRSWSLILRFSLRGIRRNRVLTAERRIGKVLRLRSRRRGDGGVGMGLRLRRNCVMPGQRSRLLGRGLRRLRKLRYGGRMLWRCLWWTRRRGWSILSLLRGLILAVWLGNHGCV